MRRIVIVLCSVAVLAGVVDAQAQGILGQNYARAEAGYIRLGNEAAKEAEALTLVIGGKVSYPIMKSVDVFASYMLSDVVGDIPDDPFRKETAAFELDVTGHTVGVGALVHLAPEEQADLFLSVEVLGATVSSGDLTLNPLTVEITVGAELRSDSPLSVRPYLTYFTTDPNVGGTMEFDQINDARLGFDASWWLHSHLFISFDGSLTFEDKDIGAFGGAGFTI